MTSPATAHSTAGRCPNWQPDPRVILGGFSSTTSLDYYLARRGRSEDRVVARWRRMVSPTMSLATTRLSLPTVIVAAVSGVERRAPLVPRTPWRGTPISVFMTAMALSAAIKLWANPNIALVTVGMTVVAVLWLTTIRDVRSSARVGP